jgi:predicted RNA-binding protein
MGYDFTYLPNVITINHEKNNNHEEHNSNIINIGCFGALRLLKNPVFQALCAIKAADILGKTLHFHVTLAKIDGYDDEHQIKLNPVLKNLEELFANSRHVLVKHEWKENKEFQHLIKKMDIGMHIVTADFINNNKLILVSEAIEWMPRIFKTSTIDYNDVTGKIIFMYEYRHSCILKKLMHRSLNNYNEKAKKMWLDFIY